MKSLEIREKQAAKEERQKEKKVETSAEKLRKLLKEEKRLKKKRKKSTSSSSCDTSSYESASSSSSDNKKRKKRSRNRSESSHGSKKHTSRMFSHPSRKEDSYSPPANTSASFLNQKHEMEKLLERQDRLAYQKPEVRDREGDYVFLNTCAEDELYGGKFEDDRDSRYNSETQANSSKTEKQSRSDRASSDRRDSTGSYRRQSDDRNKASDSGRLEKELGRREGYRKFSPSQAKYSTSPTGSDYSSKSVEHYKQYTSRWMNEPSRYNADGKAEVAWIKNEKESKNREREASQAKGVDEEAMLNGKGQFGSGAKKQLPQNLLNIFNQIAEFEREKGSKQKNQ
ncbi:tetratricopeptide repeat protein 14-like [Liasis olivaceus]